MIGMNEPATEERLAELALRAGRCCCKYCGGPLEVRLVVFGKFAEAGAELFCSKCQRIEYGTEPLIYQQAKYFVETFGFNGFPELEEGELTRRQSVAKVCEIMMWHDTKLGILDESGYTIALPETLSVDGMDGSLIYPGEEVSW